MNEKPIIEQIEGQAPATPVERLIAESASDSDDWPGSQPSFQIFSRKKPGIPLMLCGFVLPAFVVLLESATGICAEQFFDPLPTIWHSVIVAFVPIGNLYLWVVLQSENARYKTHYGVINGCTFVVSAIYSIVYLPLMPIAFLALILAGLGILPMAPMISLGASFFFARHLRRLPRASDKDAKIRARGLILGIACAVLAFGITEAHRGITMFWMQRAATGDAAAKASAIRSLRKWGQDKTMLAACGNRRREFDLSMLTFFSIANPISPEAAWQIYYRVKGNTPYARRPSSELFGESRLVQTDLDPDQTGEIDPAANLSPWMLEHLRLKTSQMDASLDPDAALGYLEWTVSLENTSDGQQEGRAEIQLPAGGVVSRLTLWVNGEEREAAFAAKGKVQAAYDAVVARRRDPVLVQNISDDRISVRCFPVPSKGEMKFRIGITAPMQFEQGDEVWMRLPYFIDRNFGVTKDFSHSVWAESRKSLQASSQSLKPEHPSDHLYGVRGQLPHLELAREYPAIKARRSAQTTVAWTVNPFNKEGEIIEQRIEPGSISALPRLVFVLDGSVGMLPLIDGIAQGISQFPEGGEYGILIASDEVIELEAMQKASAAGLQASAAKLRKQSFAGGQDNVPALLRAWDIASEKPNSLILWIHEPQAVSVTEASVLTNLKQRWQRRPEGPRLLDLQTRKGNDVAAAELPRTPGITSVLRMGKVSQELEKSFARWKAQTPQYNIVRSRRPIGKTSQLDKAKQTSSHLARLWAFDQVQALLESSENTEKAAALASTYQLVTPVTGAVVLETKEQYQQAGLEPVKQNSVPTIPEPEEWLLMIAVAIVLTWLLIQRRRQWHLR